MNSNDVKKSRHPLKDYVEEQLYQCRSQYINLSANGTMTEEDKLRLNEELIILEKIESICKERNRW